MPKAMGGPDGGGAVIRRPDAGVPEGEFIVSYDSADDLLWVGRSSCDHAQGDIVEVEKNTFVTINGESEAGAFVSSIAFTKASSHPFWERLFGGLDTAARRQAPINLSMRCDWFGRGQ